MSRKTKTRIVVATIVLGIIAWTCWSQKRQGEVRIIFVGLAPGDSHRTLFIVTNGSKRTLEYSAGWQLEKHGVWQGSGPWDLSTTKTLPGQSEQDFDFPCDSLSLVRWKAAIRYNDSPSASFIGRTRVKLATVAFEHNWDRLCMWLYPSPSAEYKYGPEMLGNQPAPPAKP